MGRLVGGIRGSRLTIWAQALVLAFAVAVAGCSDGGAEGSQSAGPRFSAASESPRVYVQRLAKLLETTRDAADCAQLADVNAHSFTRFRCPPAEAVSRSMESFEIVGADEFGTGAVVDYTSGEVDDGAAILLFVAPDRNWGVSRFGILTSPSTGTSDAESRDGYERAVESYLEAVRKRDCSAFTEVAFTGGSRGREVCRTLFADTAPLARRLRLYPSARPRYEGGNSTYGFFSLETRLEEVENSTISVVRDDSGGDDAYVVLDVAPSPPVEEQRMTIEQFRRSERERLQQQQRRQESRTTTEP